MNIAKVFKANTPLLDVRAPIEFLQGAFPNTTNIPLLTDNERHVIGLCYKQKGQSEAVRLGHKIVSGQTKSTRIKQWKIYCENNPDAYLYCFRGGMRSHLVQSWLNKEGINIPIVTGGYKAMRNFLLSMFEKPYNLIRISGHTGVGKTELLNNYKNAIDLEGLANHRGSAFGKNITCQPTQINFENSLAIKLLKSDVIKPLLVEDEGRFIGSINIPVSFFKSMKQAPIILLKATFNERVSRIYQDYVISKMAQFKARDEMSGQVMLREFLLNALSCLQKRLGSKRYEELKSLIKTALNENSEARHKQWISHLLKDYYDPMYDYQIQNMQEVIVAEGNFQEIKYFINGL